MDVIRNSNCGPQVQLRLVKHIREWGLVNVVKQLIDFADRDEKNDMASTVHVDRLQNSK